MLKTHFAQIFGAAGLGGLGAFAFASPLLAQAATSTTPLPVPGLETLSGGALVGVLCWLLQSSTRDRVREALEGSERIREIFESQLNREKEALAEHRAYVDRILATYERLVSHTNPQKPE